MNEADELTRLLRGHWVAQAIHVAARLGIADMLADGPMAVERLAKLAGANERNLYRVLRALTTVGIFTEEGREPPRFRLTPLAEQLRRDAPDSRWAAAILMGEHFQAWGHLLHTVRTGETAFDNCYGAPLFEVIARDAKIAAIADQFMERLHAREIDSVVSACDFSGMQTVVDVGGGSGSLLIAVLRRHPELQGILYDRPDVIERAQREIADLGIAERLKFMAGSFFDAVPPTADGYLLSRVLHDWSDDQAITILKNCRRAVSPGGAIIVIESIVPPGSDPAPVKLLDLAMMVLTGGNERTEAEYKDLFEAAGFSFCTALHTHKNLGVLRASAGKAAAGALYTDDSAE